MTAFSGDLTEVMCTICHQPGHLCCQKIDRKEYHINFDEEEVHDSEEEQELAGAKTSVLEPYSLGDLLNDEQAYRRKGVPESDSDEDSYYNFDNIGTNMVNSKQMKKIKLLTRDHNNNSKSMKNFYSFPVEDNECTESQLETKY